MTLTIASNDPLVEWFYEIAVFLLAGTVIFRADVRFGPMLLLASVLALWGFGQLAAGATVYRYGTLNAAVRNAALAATLLVASAVFRWEETREQFLRWFAWFGFLLGLISVLAYYTTSGKVLWLFPSIYPDVWGPFLSRNNFAQFLELALPVCLWLAWSRGGTPYLVMSAAMLGCGIASASRAGASLLIGEAVLIFVLLRRSAAPRLIPWFALGTISFAAVAGGDVLLRRMQESDPFRERREIFASSLSMIQARPWRGCGLGNFAVAYREFASFDPGRVVEHAHNDWLEWTAEGGLLYGAAWLLFAIATLRPALRSVWGIGIPAVFLHALVDYPFARLGIAAWMFVLAGALGQKEASG